MRNRPRPFPIPSLASFVSAFLIVASSGLVLADWPINDHAMVAVRRAGDDNVNTFRIPGLVRTRAGSLIAVYDVRYRSSRDLPGDIDIGLSRSTESPPKHRATAA